jgi:hypothetical protein
LWTVWMINSLATSPLPLYHRVIFFLLHSSHPIHKQIVLSLMEHEGLSHLDISNSNPSHSLIDHRLLSDIGSNKKSVRIMALRKLIDCGNRDEISRHLPKNELEFVVLILCLIIKRC